MDPKRELLRHALATIAYRGGKALRGAPEAFATFKPSESSRTPLDIVAHVGDLFAWALSMVSGSPGWQASTPLQWDAEVARLFQRLGALDAYLASDAEFHGSPEQIFQGPIADALTHIGQLSMLRRLGGSPIRGENYFKAAIAIGCVGAEQPPPRLEFD
jgi:hypothetical protein